MTDDPHAVDGEREHPAPEPGDDQPGVDPDAPGRSLFQTDDEDAVEPNEPA